MQRWSDTALVRGALETLAVMAVVGFVGLVGAHVFMCAQEPTAPSSVEEGRQP